MASKSVKYALVIAFGLAATAVPGYCDPVLTFSVVTAGGSITTTSGALTSLSNIIFSKVNIAGAADAADNGTWTLTNANLNWDSTSDVFTMGATFGGCALCVGTTNLGGQSFSSLLNGILTFSNASPAPSYTTSGTGSAETIQISFGTATSLPGINTSFLGLIGSPLSVGYITDGGVNSSGAPSISPSGSTYTWTAASETMTVNLVATPEPSSMFLIGGALIFAGVFFKRRNKQTSHC